jgi:hypothetical protein
VIAGAAAAAIALTGGSGFARRPVIASGTVFEDRAGSGKRRLGDRGIGNVMVSNGREVVRTDEDGQWRLPVADGDHLFLIKPPHWATPTDAGGIPRFSYLHQPSGSPGRHPGHHPGVTPTGPLAASIDFPLVRREEGAAFEAILLSDTQPENEMELAYLREDVIAGLIGTRAAFGINHGDVVADDLSLYPRYLQLLGTTGIPWHHCPGNHDINSDATDDMDSRETWKRVFGPRHYAFQHAEATFILLDNVHYAGYNPGTEHSGRYWGRIGESQLHFVRSVLAHVPHEHLVVVSMHIPLINHQDSSNPADNTLDRRALLQLLSSRPHTLSLSGHMHTTEHHYLGAAEGFVGAAPHHHHVLTAACGSWWCGSRDWRDIPRADSVDGTPNGGHLLSVDGHHYTTRFMPAAGKSSAQLRVMIDGPCRRTREHAAALDAGLASRVPVDALEGCEIIANVFDGGPRTRVSCQVAGVDSSPRPMQWVSARDPFVVAQLQRTGAVRKPWVKPVSSSHLWTVPLPAGLTPGAHRVTVRAADEYGRQHTAHIILEVTAPARHS